MDGVVLMSTLLEPGQPPREVSDDYQLTPEPTPEPTPPSTPTETRTERTWLVFKTLTFAGTMLNMLTLRKDSEGVETDQRVTPHTGIILSDCPFREATDGRVALCPVEISGEDTDELVAGPWTGKSPAAQIAVGVLPATDWVDKTVEEM